MPDIDRLLPKPADEMSLADMLEFMDGVEAKLLAWMGTLGEREPFRMIPDHVLEAVQCIAWGREALRMVKETVEHVDVTPEYNLDEAVWFIHHRTDVDPDTIRKVLDAEETYMEDKGIIPKEEPEDILTVPGVQ